jgi:uncharacterized protein involved in exopolysaccharide biosynthesis
MTESQENLSVNYGDEIDLRELFRVLWAGKWLIGGATLAAALFSVIVALILPNIYRAEALLAPNDQSTTSGLSALAAQYGGLASLAGISLGDGSADKTVLGIETLKSRKFISEFIERHDILVPLMAAKGWNMQTGELEIDADAYDVDTEKWVRDAKPPRTATPSAQEAYKEFSNLLSVSQDKKTGLVTVAVEHYSPVIAKQWVDWLVSDLNSTVMRQAVVEAEQAIDYLNKQVNSTSLSGLQTVFFALIEEQTKTVMLARVSPEYLLRTIDPAVAPERKAKPRRAIICIVGTMLGGLFGMFVVLARNGKKVKKQ